MVVIIVLGRRSQIIPRKVNTPVNKRKNIKREMAIKYYC